MEKRTWKRVLGLIGLIPLATLVAVLALYADQRPSVRVALDRDAPSSPTLGGNFQVPVLVKNEGKTTAKRFHWFVLQCPLVNGASPDFSKPECPRPDDPSWGCVHNSGLTVIPEYDLPEGGTDLRPVDNTCTHNGHTPGQPQSGNGFSRYEIEQIMSGKTVVYVWGVVSYQDAVLGPLAPWFEHGESFCWTYSPNTAKWLRC